jgi:glycosyltransferase involved in cell wall biosynthesis
MRQGTAATLERGRDGRLDEPPGGPLEKRVATVFLYYRPRDELVVEVAAGRAPDTALLGSNHLADLGIDTSVRAPRSQLDIKYRKLGPFGRLAWSARELPAPWEFGDADVACSFWVRFFPLAARLRGRPAVVAFNISVCTDYLRSSAPRRRLQQAALRSSASVVCFASAQRERLLELYRLDPERVHMVPFAVDERFFRPLKPPGDGYVLAVGKDVARDYATFGRAVENLDARAIIVGGEACLQGVKLPGNVEARTKVPYRELRALYEGAGCVVIATRRDGYPFGADCSGQTTLLEALAMGRPVVASERATLSDYVTDRTALMVPPEDPSALRSGIERALSDRRLAREMGAAGRRAVEDRFTTRHLARRLAPIIRDAAATHRPR